MEITEVEGCVPIFGGLQKRSDLSVRSTPPNVVRTQGGIIACHCSSFSIK